jgi:hypothetical protein
VAVRGVLLTSAPRARLGSRVVSRDVVSVRIEWEDAHRGFVDAARDPAHEASLLAQLETITAQLRRRVGGVFTLAELAGEYALADTWARHALSELGVAGWVRTLSLVEGAAFHLYSRGATDYTP